MTRADKFEEIFGYRPATDQVLCNEHDWCGKNDACNYCTSNPNNIGREEDWWGAEYKENKTYKIFCIGGDPKTIAFLGGELSGKIDDLQDSGWEIVSVDLINNTRAWDSGKQMYVETPEYIIHAKKEG